MDERDAMPLERQLDRLMHEAWPCGVPPAEAALARAMPPDRLTVTAERLDAVLEEERGHPLQDAAGRLGMDRVAFFRLRQRWKKTRSLRSLTPFIGRAPRRVGIGREGEAELALKLVEASGPAADLAELTDRLLQVSEAMSRQTAMRLIREASVRASAGLTQLADELGTEVLVDFCGTAMATDHDGRGVIAVCLVVERASRFILGWGAGPVSQSGEILMAALDDAVSAFRGLPDGARFPGRVRIVVPDADRGFDAFAFVRAAHSTGLVLMAEGERRFGRRLVALLGHRIGRMSLHPRAYGRGEAPIHGMTTARRLDLDDAMALVAEAVRDHNRARCEALLEVVRSEDPGLAVMVAAKTADQTPAVVFDALVSGFQPWRLGADRLAATIAELNQALSLVRACLAPRIRV